MKTAHPLRKLTLLSVLAALAAPAAASAQAYVSVQVGLPAIVVPAAPSLVEVEPRVEVVQDIGEEVFFVDGYYWARHGDGWYRAHDRRARWGYVEPHRVPGALVRIPPGYYRNWHPGRPHHGWRHPQYWRRPHPYGPRHGEWDRAGWQHRARPHDPVTERRWTEARWSPSVHARHGHGHR
jgi:hypothetical protein